MATARSTVEQHVATFNAHDTSGLVDGLAADAVWRTGHDVVRGRAALADLFDDGLWQLAPSLRTLRLIADEHNVAAELEEELTVDGEQRRFQIAAFFTVSAGLITQAKIYREGSADLD